MGIFDSKALRVYKGVTKELEGNVDPDLAPILVNGIPGFRVNEKSLELMDQISGKIPDLRRMARDARGKDFVTIPEDSVVMPALNDFLRKNAAEINNFTSNEMGRLMPVGGIGEEELAALPEAGALMPGQEIRDSAMARSNKEDPYVNASDSVMEDPTTEEANDAAILRARLPERPSDELGTELPPKQIRVDEYGNPLGEGGAGGELDAFKSLTELAEQDLDDGTGTDGSNMSEQAVVGDDIAEGMDDSYSGFTDLAQSPDLQQDAAQLDIEDFLDSFGLGLGM